MRVRFGLSEEETANFPHKNVLTMAVGTTPEIVIRTREETIEPGDVVLLCSDGLTGPVSETAIAATLSTDVPLPDLVARLINQAKASKDLAHMDEVVRQWPFFGKRKAEYQA